MAIFILDGGLFVGRFERQKHKRGKSYWWWKRQHQSGLISTKEYREGVGKSFQNDINHFKFKMSTVDDIDKVIVCYDGIYGRRKRGEIFKHYKSHKSGIKATKHKGHDVRLLIEDCGFEAMEIEEGWEGHYDEFKEADDLVAEQVIAHLNSGQRIVILSEDKDMLQMLSWGSNVSVHNLRELITPELFELSWDIKPSQFVEWKCLVGDVSDNIKGIQGWGPKKATNLLRKYGSVANFPIEQKISYKPVQLDLIKSCLESYRQGEGLSLSYCSTKLKIASWKRLESGKSETLVPYSQAVKMFELMPNIKELFEEVDNEAQVELWKQIIQLPFD